MKSGFEPAQTTGINRFNWYGENVVIVHPGGYLPQIISGECVMFSNGSGTVWCGRTWPGFYEFELERPVDIRQALDYLSSKHRMLQVNQDDFSGQEELPF